MQGVRQGACSCAGQTDSPADTQSYPQLQPSPSTQLHLFLQLLGALLGRRQRLAQARALAVGRLGLGQRGLQRGLLGLEALLGRVKRLLGVRDLRLFQG